MKTLAMTIVVVLLAVIGIERAWAG